MKTQKTAIICAMDEELAAFRDLAEDDMLLVKSGVGKVNAAVATMYAIQQGATHIISAGFAGSIYQGFHPGDIVVIGRAIQHDVDATALGFKRSEIPYAEQSAWRSDSAMMMLFFASVLSICGVIHCSTILSGDRFVTDGRELAETLVGGCVDMETAAIAHVCHLKQIPWAGIRLISDHADHQSPKEFEQAASTTSLDTVARIVYEALRHKETSQESMDMPNARIDPDFESLLASESPGVRDSARSLYYGEAYDYLFEPVVTSPRSIDAKRGLIPIHTDQENSRASQLVDDYTRMHPDRAERFGFQV
jgi:adenosylhomocysteine nucleosidase